MQTDLWHPWRGHNTVAVRTLAGSRTGPIPTRAMSPTNPPSAPDAGHRPMATGGIRRTLWSWFYGSGTSGEDNRHAGGPQ